MQSDPVNCVDDVGTAALGSFLADAAVASNGRHQLSSVLDLPPNLTRALYNRGTERASQNQLKMQELKWDLCGRLGRST